MRIAALQKNKTLLLWAAFSLTIVYFFLAAPPHPPPARRIPVAAKFHFNFDQSTIDPLLQKSIEEWWALRNSTKNLSKLGEILFLNHPELEVNQSDKRYQILVWKYGRTIERRHLKRYSGQRIDPFEYCPVKNCDITYKENDLKTADIVIFHLHRMKGVRDLPQERNPNQIWAFLTDESPFHTFLHTNIKLEDFNNVFNWSMSYRSDTDIPVPYGRTILKKSPLIDGKELGFVQTKRRDILIAMLGSNCGGKNHRWKYVAELQKYIQVDVYGRCGPVKKKCPGSFTADCPAINDYLFYLAFENSNCDEYITEKLWWNAFQKNSIPIVMGASATTYKKLLPVDSYINVDDFANPQVLAQYLLRLNETEEFMRLHRWRNHFEVLNEHGYFKSRSYHYCRICQALNYNAKDRKVYTDLENYWSVKRDCHPPWDDWKE